MCIRVLRVATCLERSVSMSATMKKTGLLSGEITFVTRAAPGVVYDYLADFPRHPDWAGSLVKLTQTSAGPAGVGTTYRTEEQARPGSKMRDYTICEVTALDRPRR